MWKLLIPVIINILQKLVEQFLTAEKIEKYSDVLIDLCRKAAEKIDNEEIVEFINGLLDIVDDMIGE